MKQETEVNFDTNNIQSVKLNLLNGQVDIILRALELYSYNLEYMLNGENSPEEERQEKLKEEQKKQEKKVEKVIEPEKEEPITFKQEEVTDDQFFDDFFADDE